MPLSPAPARPAARRTRSRSDSGPVADGRSRPAPALLSPAPVFSPAPPSLLSGDVAGLLRGALLLEACRPVLQVLQEAAELLAGLLGLGREALELEELPVS